MWYAINNTANPEILYVITNLNDLDRMSDVAEHNCGNNFLGRVSPAFPDGGFVNGQDSLGNCCDGEVLCTTEDLDGRISMLTALVRR